MRLKSKQIVSVAMSAMLVITSFFVQDIHGQAAAWAGMEYNSTRTGTYGTNNTINWLYYKDVQSNNVQQDKSALILEGTGAMPDITRNSCKDQYDVQEWYKYCIEADDETLDSWDDRQWDTTSAMCRKLSEVYVGGEITNVGKSTFHWQPNIKKVWIGKSVKKLDARCFASGNMKDIYIYGNVSTVAETAFNSFTNLQTIHVASQSTEEEIGYALEDSGAEAIVVVDLITDATPLRIALKKGQIEQNMHPEGVGYTPKSWAVLAEKLESGQAAITELETLEAQKRDGDTIDAATVTDEETKLATATEAINTALEGLVSTQALDVVLAAVEQLDQYDYTADSWTAFQGALETAKTALKNAETESQVQTLATDLTADMNRLVKRSPEEVKGELETVMNSVKGLVESNYTNTSWKALQQAIETAETAAKGDSVGTIVRAKAALEKALNGLQVQFPDGLLLLASVPKGGTPVTITSGTADSKMTGAVKVEITFDCAEDVSYNNYADIDLSYDIGGTTEYKKFKGTDGDNGTKGSKGWKESLDIKPGTIKEGTKYSVSAATWAWNNAKGDVYRITAVKFYDADGNVLKSIEAAKDIKDVVAKAVAAAEEKLASLVEGDYTEASWSKATAAIAEIKALKNVEGMLPSEISAIQEKLEKVTSTSADGLVVSDNTAAKADLGKTVSDTEAAYKESDYTAASWKVLKDALDAAKKVSDNALISEIEALKKGVLDAVKALEKAQAGDQNPTPTPPAGPVGDTPVGDEPVTKPGKPAIKKVDAKKSTVTVTLKKNVAGATSYQVVVANNKKFTKATTVTVKSGKKLTLSVKYKKLKVKKKGKYFVKVRAVKKSGSQNVYGSYSAVKKFTAK